MHRKAFSYLATGLVAIFFVTTQAAAYSSSVKRACKSDFYRFCPSYKVGSTKLRNCMRSAGGNLSRRCVDALANAGEISRKYHSRYRR